MQAETVAQQHQFDTLSQQYDAGHLGMWIFLITEILFFGGVFVCYIVYRSAYPEAWALGSRLNDANLAAAMTATLLLSSFTMAMAVRSAQVGSKNSIVLFLILTMILGAAFLGMKFFEYHSHWQEHLVPGINFSGYHGAHAPQVELFICFYFIMTAIHALHMIIGIGILAVLTRMAWKGRFNSTYFAPVDISGLYWHFVDIVWIFLFPLLYLVDLHK